MTETNEEEASEASEEEMGSEEPATQTEEPTRPPEGFVEETEKRGVWDPSSPSGYWRISAIVLVAVALLGIVLNLLGEGSQNYFPSWEFMESVLVFDWPHNIVHIGLAAIALVFGFTGLRTSQASKPTAGVIGVVYLLLGIAGFFPAFADLLADGVGLHLEIGENIFHLLLGGWGAFVGFVSDEPF